jgi:hypothetical protein
MTNYSYEKDKEAITWIFAIKPINSIW